MNLGSEARPPPQRFACADWLGLIYLPLASPLIAAGIQSVWVFRGGFRIYQAAIGGAYFHSVKNPGLATIGFIIVSCGIFGIPTFLAMLLFWRPALSRWLVWAGSIAAWSWFYIGTLSHFTIK